MNSNIKTLQANIYLIHISIRLIVNIKMRGTGFGKVIAIGNAVNQQRE